jgi:hypothetical protein
VLVLVTLSYFACVFSLFENEDENDDEDDGFNPVTRNSQPAPRNQPLPRPPPLGLALETPADELSQAAHNYIGKYNQHTHGRCRSGIAGIVHIDDRHRGQGKNRKKIGGASEPDGSLAFIDEISTCKGDNRGVARCDPGSFSPLKLRGNFPEPGNFSQKNKPIHLWTKQMMYRN